MVWPVDGVCDARGAWLPSTPLNQAVTPVLTFPHPLSCRPGQRSQPLTAAWSAWMSCWATSWIGTKHMVGRVTAAAMASASRLSCLFDLTYGLTHCGVLSLTSWPYARMRLAQ